MADPSIAASQSDNLPDPVSVVVLPFLELPDGSRDAVKHCFPRSPAVLKDLNFRRETYMTPDILDKLFRQRWSWASDAAKLRPDGMLRVTRICELIRLQGVCWPYYSYMAASMAELYEDVFGDLHGDGWHRMMAQEFLGLDTVQVLFHASQPDWLAWKWQD